MKNLIKRLKMSLMNEAKELLIDYIIELGLACTFFLVMPIIVILAAICRTLYFLIEISKVLFK